MSVVPSDHGCVNMYTRAPLAASSRRSSATAPLAVYRIKCSDWSVDARAARGTQADRVNLMPVDPSDTRDEV
jgi:hypothetical protein